MKPAVCAGLAVFLQITAAHAQVQPSDVTTRVVSGVSEAFLDQIVTEDFAAERKFLSARLSAMVSEEEWKSIRLQTIALAGKTQRYSAHGLTYYTDGSLLAAVDFSGPTEQPDTVICGFMLWELPDERTIGLLRLEQNVVPLNTFRSMPVAEAAQLMVSLRCPAKLIEQSLGVRLE